MRQLHNRVCDPPYAQRVNADLIPVLEDGELQSAVDNLPRDGNPITKCILLADRLYDYSQLYPESETASLL